MVLLLPARIVLFWFWYFMKPFQINIEGKGIVKSVDFGKFPCPHNLPFSTPESPLGDKNSFTERWKCTTLNYTRNLFQNERTTVLPQSLIKLIYSLTCRHEVFRNIWRVSLKQTFKVYMTDFFFSRSIKAPQCTD